MSNFDASSMFTVTPLGQSTPRKRVRGPQTIAHADFDSTLARDTASINKVVQLRTEIEQREARVAQLREALERENEVEMSEMPNELKRLQAAFENVQQICAQRINPVQDQLNQLVADHGAKEHKVETMTHLAQERNTYFQQLSEKASNIIGDLHDPQTSNETDEKHLYPIVKEATEVITDLNNTEQRISQENYVESTLNKLNEELARYLTYENDEEQKMKRRVETVRKNIEVKCTRPKVNLINEDWVNAKKTLEVNNILLKDVNNTIKLFNHEAEKLASENRAQNENISALREELISLEKFLPDEKQSKGSQRSDMTAITTETDTLAAKLKIAQQKQKMEEKILKSLIKMKEKSASQVERKNQELEEAKAERVKCDVELQNSQDIRSNLLAQQKFLEGQSETMKVRIKEQSEQIRSIEEDTEKLNAILKRQKLIMELNESLFALKKSNLGRVAGIVDKVLKIKNEIPEGE